MIGLQEHAIRVANLATISIQNFTVNTRNRPLFLCFTIFRNLVLKRKKNPLKFTV